VAGSGSPDGAFDFFDPFDDNALTSAATSEFVSNQGLFPVSESGGFLHLSSADGANSFSPGFLVDNCGLGLRHDAVYRLVDGHGNAVIDGSFRADAPLPTQGYGLQVFTYTANDVINIQVSGGCGALSCVTALATLPSFVTETVPVDLAGVHRIILRLQVDDATNQVSHSFSTDGGASFTTITLPSPVATFTSGSSEAVVSVVGSMSLRSR
jgi:hypothetical protein